MGKIVFEEEEIRKLKTEIDNYKEAKKAKRSRENEYVEEFKEKIGGQEERTYYLGDDSIAILESLESFSKRDLKDWKNCEIIIFDGDYGTGKTNLLDIHESISMNGEEDSKLLIEKMEIFQSGYEENLLHYITTSFEDIQSTPKSSSKRVGILKRGMTWIVLIATIPIFWDALKFIFERNSFENPSQEAISLFNLVKINYVVRDISWIILFIVIIAISLWGVRGRVKKHRSDMMIYKKDYQEYFFETAISHIIEKIEKIENKERIIIAFEDIDRIYKEENIIEVLRIIFKLKQKINEESGNKKLLFILTLSMENLRERFDQGKVIEPVIMKLSPKYILPLKPQSIEYQKMIKKEHFPNLMLKKDEDYLVSFLNGFSHLINWRMLWSIGQSTNFYYECLKLILASEYVKFKDEGEYIEVGSQDITEDIRYLFEVIESIGEVENCLHTYEILEITSKSNEDYNNQKQTKVIVKNKESTIDQLSREIKRLDDKSEKAKRLYAVLQLYFTTKNDEKKGNYFLELLMENVEVVNFLTSIKEEQEGKFDEDIDEDIDIGKEMISYLSEITKKQNIETGELTENFFSRSQTEEFRKILEEYIFLNNTKEDYVPPQQKTVLTASTPLKTSAGTKKVGNDYAVDEGIDFSAVIVPAPISSTIGKNGYKTIEEQKDELLRFYSGGGKVDE